MSEQKPIHISIRVGQMHTDTRSRVCVDGVDITRHCRGVKVEAGVGALTGVWLDLIGITLDVEADVPGVRVQQMTFEEDEAHQRAQQTVDRERGQKVRRPEARLAISLGEVKP